MSNSSTYWTFRVTARIPRCPVRSSRPQPLVPPNYYRKTGDPRIACKSRQVQNLSAFVVGRGLAPAAFCTQFADSPVNMVDFRDYF